MSRFETGVLTQDGQRGRVGLSERYVGGPSDDAHGAPAGGLGHGQFGESGTWRTGGSVVQRTLWEHVLSPFVRVQSAHEWRQVLEPILSRYEEKGVRRYFRADAAFAKPDIYEYLEERRVFYAIRLPSNKVLQWEIAPLLIRPVGRPPKRPVILSDDFWYRAGSWPCKT